MTCVQNGSQAGKTSHQGMLGERECGRDKRRNNATNKFRKQDVAELHQWRVRREMSGFSFQAVSGSPCESLFRDGPGQGLDCAAYSQRYRPSFLLQERGHFLEGAVRVKLIELKAHNRLNVNRHYATTRPHLLGKSGKMPQKAVGRRTA